MDDLAEVRVDVLDAVEDIVNTIPTASSCLKTYSGLTDVARRAISHFICPGLLNSLLEQVKRKVPLLITLIIDFGTSL